MAEAVELDALEEEFEDAVELSAGRVEFEDTVEFVSALVLLMTATAVEEVNVRVDVTEESSVSVDAAATTDELRVKICVTEETSVSVDAAATADELVDASALALVVVMART